MKKNKTNNRWFKEVRGSYVPQTWQGALLYIPFIGFLILVLYIASHEATFTDAVLLVFPLFVSATIVMTWIAQKKS